MNVLVVGGGAREHAICDLVCRSEDVTLFSVMHNLNPGIERLSNDYLLENETNVKHLVDYAKRKNIELVIVGPEAPLEAGLVDKLHSIGVQSSSPTQKAARIETDKEWMRHLLDKHRIRGRLRYESFTDVEKAKRFIKELNNDVVIKPIGLTGGKGVKVSGDHFYGVDDAVSYVKEVITKRVGGKARVLIEEKAVGEEFTLQALSDGHSILPFHAVQDHKRLLPGDKGPNTGGMGSYSCADGLLPFLSKSEYEESATILQHIIEALAKEDCQYIGPIYGQFMLTAEGPKIIEINARFGDPENMNILPLLQTDYIDLCEAMVTGQLSSKKIRLRKKSTVCKYVVPEGYGVKSLVNEKIDVDEGSIRDTGSTLFYASVNKRNNQIFTTSSRSLAVVGIADEIFDAEQVCEKALTHIRSNHIFIRHDIGTRELIDQRLLHMNALRGIV